MKKGADGALFVRVTLSHRRRRWTTTLGDPDAAVFVALRRLRPRYVKVVLAALGDHERAL
jgi:hypothetical protein